MSALFISHSSKDNLIAADIAAWLRVQGYASIFLDFDPADGIPAGRSWEKELYKELKTCRAMVVLCSEHSQTSEWCFAEMIHAKMLGKDIFPVKVAPCTLRPLLTSLQVIDLTHDREEGFQRLRRGLSKAGMDAGEDYTPGLRPLYPGLTVYQEEDAQIFFGRGAEIQACLDLLRRLREFGGARLVLILGASGSGKSSLLRAGVIPRLKRARAGWRVVGPVRPSLLSLDKTPDGILSQLFPEFDPEAYPHGMPGNPGELDPASLRGLATDASGADSMALVFIDQLEELLDKNLDEIARHLLGQLAAMLGSPDCRILAVATLRSDFLGEFQQHAAFRDIRVELLQIGPLSRERFTEVVENPAMLEGIELEQGLVWTIVDDTETADALPLLAFTLRELWEHCREDGKLTIAEYRRLGGLQGSVARAAEAVLHAEASSEEQKAELRDAFIPLVRMDEQERYVRRMVRWSSIDQRFHSLLERFVAKRLLVAKSKAGDRVLEVAHEALFSTWQRLNQWLGDDRENLRLREGLRRAAREWEAGKRPEDLLNHRHVLLQAVEKLVMEPRFGIDSVERAYLDACVRARDEFQKEKNRRELAKRRRLHYTIASLILTVLLISGFGLFATYQWKTARENLTRLHWVNGVFARDRSGDVLKASHHFMEAAELAGDDMQSRTTYLAGALVTRGLHLGLILDHGKALESAVFGRDPQQIWTWDKSGTGRAWNLPDGKILQTVEFEGNPQSVSTSPWGGWLMGPGSDANIRVVNARNGQGVLTTRQKQDYWPVFNDDESKLASWTNEGQVSIFDLIKAAETAKLQAPYKEIRKVVLSRSGERVLAMGNDNAVILFRNGDSGESCETPIDSPMVGALFSPDDSRMFSWTQDGSAFLWDTRNGCNLSTTLPGHAENPTIIGGLFSGNSRFIFTWNFGAEGALSRWDADTEKSIAFQAANHPGDFAVSSAIRRGVLSKDESRLLTSADDGKARLWDAESGKELRALSHRASVRGAVFNADANLVLTWSDDGSAMLWNAGTGESIGFPLRHSGRVRWALFSDDGKYILTRGEDKTARLWLIEDQPVDFDFKLLEAPLAVFWKESEGKLSVLTKLGNLEAWSEQGKRTHSRHLGDEILEGQFNHDSSRILTRSKDQTVRLWNTETGEPVTPPLRHLESRFGILGVGYSPDERWLLSWGDDHTARLWDGETGKLLLPGLEHRKAVRGVVVNSDRSRVLTWSDERLVRLWDAQKGTILLSLADGLEVLGARLLKDSSEILTWSSDGRIRVWDAQSGSEQRVFRHADALAGAALNADGSRLLSWAIDGTARLWDTEHSEKEICPALREPSVAGGALNADESLILTWSETGDLHLWDSGTGQPLTKALRHGHRLAGASLSHDASRILAWSHDGWVKVWHLNVPPPQTPVLQQQLRSGTRLDSLGEVEVLDADTWNGQVSKPH